MRTFNTHESADCRPDNLCADCPLAVYLDNQPPPVLPGFEDTTGQPEPRPERRARRRRKAPTPRDRDLLFDDESNDGGVA